MPTPESSIFEIGFDGAVSADDPVPVPIPRGGEIELRDFTGDVWVRLNNTSAERRPARAGETLCYQEGLVTKVLLDNGGGDGGSVELEVRKGFTVRGFGGSEVKRRLPQPRRLQGDLAPGTTIADGEDADEDVDTSDASSLRVRARVSGTSQLTEGTQASIANAQALAVDPENGLAVTLDNEANSITVRVWSLSDVDAPTELGNTTLTGLTGTEVASSVVGVDPAAQVAVAVVNDDNSSHLITVGYSTPSSPSHEGTVGLPQDFGADRRGGIYFDADDDLVVVAYQGSSNGRLSLVDYSTVASPSVASTVSLSGPVLGLAGDADERVLWLQVSATIEARSYTDTTLGPAIGDVTMPEPGAGDGGTIRYDADRSLLVVRSFSSSGNIWGVDVTDPLLPELLWSGPLSTALRGLEIDPSRRVLVVFLDLNGEARFYGYSRDGLGGVGDTLQSDDVRATGIYPDAGPVVYGLEDSSSGGITPILVEPGSDVLLVRPLLTDGSVATEGGASPVTLRDGVEELVDLGLGGENRVEVRVQARSGVQTEVDYVEQYRR